MPRVASPTDFVLVEDQTTWTEGNTKFTAGFDTPSLEGTRFFASVSYNEKTKSFRVDVRSKTTTLVSDFLVAFKKAMILADIRIHQQEGNIEVNTTHNYVSLQMKESTYRTLVRRVFEYLNNMGRITGSWPEYPGRRGT